MSKPSLLEQIVPLHWNKGGDGTQRVRYLQSVDDLVNRPKLNRNTVSTNAVSVACNGGVQSTGVGTIPLQPKRYAEFTVKARVTFNLSSGSGPAYIYIYRTSGSIPPNGASPPGGDIIVGGDAFTGGTSTPGANFVGAFSYIDTGLDVTKSYSYYLVVLGPNGVALNLINASQIFVMERS